MTISRRSFVAAAIAAIAGGGSIAAAAVAVKKEPELPVVPPARSPEPKFDFGPVDWDNVPRAKWNTTSRPRETHYLGRSLGYNGHPDMVASFGMSSRLPVAWSHGESVAWDGERSARDRLTRLLEESTAGDGILYRVLPEITRENGIYPGEVIFRQYARAVGERKTVKRVVFRKNGCDVAADMTVEYDSTVGEGEITVSCGATHDLILSSPYNVGEIIRRGVRLQLIDEARERWGMATTALLDCPERESCFIRTFRQSMRKITSPSYCFGFPPTAHIAAQLRGYNFACKVNAESGVPQ